MDTRARRASSFFYNDTATTEIYTLSLHDALPIWKGRHGGRVPGARLDARARRGDQGAAPRRGARSEEHTSELQSQSNLVCRLLLEKKKQQTDHAFVRSAVAAYRSICVLDQLRQHI